MLIDVPELASACNVPPVSITCPSIGTSKLSPAANDFADKTVFDALALPADGTRYTVAVTAPPDVLVNRQADITVLVLAGAV